MIPSSEKRDRFSTGLVKIFFFRELNKFYVFFGKHVFPQNSIFQFAYKTIIYLFNCRYKKHSLRALTTPSRDLRVPYVNHPMVWKWRPSEFARWFASSSPIFRSFSWMSFLRV